MIDLKLFIGNILQKTENPKTTNLNDIVSFFQANDWFGSKPTLSQGKVLLSPEQQILFKEPLIHFLSTKNSISTVRPMLEKKFPSTAKDFLVFSEKQNLDEDTVYYIIDFLLYHLVKDLRFYTNQEASALVETATMDLTKAHGDTLTFFMASLRKNKKTLYNTDFVMGARYTMQLKNEAYDFDEYLELLYMLYNPTYINSHQMYQKAADSINYTDTWLYLSMHFICSLRQTDLKRIYHPDLMYPPEQIIDMIRNNTFSDNDARKILLSITTRMRILPFMPSKTESKSGIPFVKIEIPMSCEVHIGKLFALAEAHRQLSGKPELPIIRKIRTYHEIKRYMGEEIGHLFLENDFRARSATKSYLQSIFHFTDDVLADSKVPHTKGYLLAAIARSHKGSYGEFAHSTFFYLKDAKFNGLTPEFVLFELMERGVLSFIPSMLLKMLTGKHYDALTVQNQTALHKSLNMTPLEIDTTIATVNKGMECAKTALKEMVGTDADILAILHRIGSAQSFSKESDCDCLCTAAGRNCPDPEKRCIACKYEISTKSTLYLLLAEVKRIKELLPQINSDLEKKKYKELLSNILFPKLDEILYVLKQNYGDEVFKQYENMMKEAFHS